MTKFDRIFFSVCSAQTGSQKLSNAGSYFIDKRIRIHSSLYTNIAGVLRYEDRQQDDGPHHNPAARRRGAEDRGEFQSTLHKRKGNIYILCWERRKNISNATIYK